MSYVIRKRLFDFRAIVSKMSMYCVAEVAHQNDWDGIIACHQGYITCTTWNYQKTSMGAHKLRPEEFSKNKPIDIYATVSLLVNLGYRQHYSTTLSCW